MTPAITLNSVEKFRALPVEKRCYAELCERIAAIWQAICAWISGLFASVPIRPVVNQDDITQRSLAVFYHMTNFLEPEELARCETVCKFWKIPERIWQARSVAYGITSVPESGSYKEIFAVPKMAFGPREWVKYGWGEPGPMPPLPVNIRALAKERIKTHTLTLIPKAVNGEPLSYKTFRPIALKSDVVLGTPTTFSGEEQNEPQEKSVWVWMQKHIEPGTYGITQEDAEKRYSLGKAFWITVSAVAHYVQTKCIVFPMPPMNGFTRTRDKLRDLEGYLIVGFTSHRILEIAFNNESDTYVGVAPTFLA